MLGALIGAAASIGSTILGQKQTDKNNAIAQQNAARQEALQREFAQNGISWKVEDAKRAGIHPLYALGANTSSYSPVSVGTSSTDFSALSSAGQDIGRAITAQQTSAEKRASIATTALQLEGLKLDNDLKRAQLASSIQKITAPGTPPGVPTNGGRADGVGLPIQVSDNNELSFKTERDVSDPRNPVFVAGTGPSVSLIKNSTGGYDIAMPEKVAEQYESDPIGTLFWQARNRLVPGFSGDGYPGYAIPANPPGIDDSYEMHWNGYKQQWEPRKKIYGPPLDFTGSYYGGNYNQRYNSRGYKTGGSF